MFTYFHKKKQCQDRRKALVRLYFWILRNQNAIIATHVENDDHFIEKRYAGASRNFSFVQNIHCSK